LLQGKYLILTEGLGVEEKKEFLETFKEVMHDVEIDYWDNTNPDYTPNIDSKVVSLLSNPTEYNLERYAKNYQIISLHDALKPVPHAEVQHTKMIYDGSTLWVSGLENELTRGLMNTFAERHVGNDLQIYHSDTNRYELISNKEVA